MLTPRCIAFFWLLVAAQTRTVAEVIGDFRVIDAPVHASLLLGDSAAFTWLNVNDEPVSVADAFTGFGVIDDGLAHAPAGTLIELTFADGALRNDAGPDLVLFDADFDRTVYFVTISSGNPGHIGEFSDFIDTGVDRNYFSGDGGGSRSYDIFAATLDLSEFGVPVGDSVEHVRIFLEDLNGDPLALSVLLSACPPDVDGNGLVELSDLTQLLAAFGSTVGGASWNPHADLDADGSIGLADLAELLASFGEQC